MYDNSPKSHLSMYDITFKTDTSIKVNDMKNSISFDNKYYIY